MKKIVFGLFLFSITTIISAQGNYDIVIVGGNPGGLTAAIAAARLGNTVLVLERTEHLGGLPANGLGATDLITREATTGIFKEFTFNVKDFYVKKYGQNSKQVQLCSEGYHFEPSVAEQVFEGMLTTYKQITVLKMRQFNSNPINLTVEDDRITKIGIWNRETKQTEEYFGKIFIDATYEGDLAAAAGVPYRLGREGRDEYNELVAGKLYKYWKFPEGEGTTFQADNAVQAYNFRLCLTNDPKNRTAIPKPDKYDRDEYASMVEDVWTGRHTGKEMLDLTPDAFEKNRERLKKGLLSEIPWEPWGIKRITNMVPLPNGKTDANNQHFAFISTDLPEENWPWPTSDWEWRDQYVKRLRNYTLGLFWFAQNDSALPEHFREDCAQWGLAKDEYTDNENFPRQVYVREGRRIEGLYLFTTNDVLPQMPGQRPIIHSRSITASHYDLDSHAVRKREEKRVHLDGFFSYPTSVYTVPYEVIVPKKVDNLLVPIAVSATHVGFSTLRMEPCWMAMGQAAGIAANIAINDTRKVKNIDMDKLQGLLLDQGATLMYFKDMNYKNPDFKMVQTMALKGFLTDWEAALQKPIDKEIIDAWQQLCEFKITGIPGKTSRGEILYQIYNQLKK
jgi:hypothetical protein